MPLRALLLLGAGLLACAAVAWQWRAVGQHLHQLQAQHRSQGRPAEAPAVLAPAEAAALAADLQAAQRVVQRLNQPWPQLFRALENVRVPGVVLLAIQPESSGEGQRFKLVAQAPRYRAALDYVAALTATPGLRRAYLAAHETAADSTAATVPAAATALQFTVQVHWEPVR